MAKKLVLTRELLEEFHALSVLPRYNSPKPEAGHYGWMKEGSEIVISQPLTIEENVGLYGGLYKAFRGGKNSHGFATVGSFSSCASPLPEKMVVGRYCGISTNFRVLDSQHPIDTLTMSGAMFRPNNNIYKRVSTPALREYATGFRHTPDSYPSLGNDVWIGANVTMLASVRVGTGALIASGAMVTKDVPPYAVVGGNPAKIIRYRFPSETVTRLLESSWWNYEPTQVFETDPTDIERVLQKVEAGQLDEYRPREIVLGS